MEEQTNEETPQAEELMGEDEEEEDEEEEEAEEMTDAEIVELGETETEAQVDVAVNVELGADTVTEADAYEEPPEEMHTAEEEVTEVGPEEHPLSPQGSSAGLAVEEGDDDLDQPATAASKDQLDVLDAPTSTPTVPADTVAPEDTPSQPDTLGADVRLGRYTAADYEAEVEVVDEQAEYGEADTTDEIKDEERPSIAVSRPLDVPGAIRCYPISVLGANVKYECKLQP